MFFHNLSRKSCGGKAARMHAGTLRGRRVACRFIVIYRPVCLPSGVPITRPSAFPRVDRPSHLRPFTPVASLNDKFSLFLFFSICYGAKITGFLREHVQPPDFQFFSFSRSLERTFRGKRGLHDNVIKHMII